jgi:hypothetical protein
MTATEVVFAAAGIRRGWYCADCGHFDQALLREREVENE